MPPSARALLRHALAMTHASQPLAPVHVERKILSLRGERVLLDADLAVLYGVPTKQLVRAVQRNAERFPADFMFQLTEEEDGNLRCQFGTSRSGHGGPAPACLTIRLNRDRRAADLVFDLTGGEHTSAVTGCDLKAPRSGRRASRSKLNTRYSSAKVMP